MSWRRLLPARGHQSNHKQYPGEIEMIPGPTKIIACPACGALHKAFTLISGNTFGGTFWTDGYGDYPMLPRFPAVTKCHICSHIFWIRNAAVVGEFDGMPTAQQMRAYQEEKASPPSVPMEWEGAPVIKHLDLDDCCRALAERRYAGPEEEGWLCVHAWHCCNHRVRRLLQTAGIQDIRALSPKRIARWHLNRNDVTNSAEMAGIMDRLLVLLGGIDPHDRILTAEALRELERFDEASALLESDFPEDFQRWVSCVANLTDRHEHHVHPVQ